MRLSLVRPATPPTSKIETYQLYFLATLMHALLFFRKQIWVQSRRALHEQPDIHARLMSRYPQGSLPHQSTE